MEPHGKIKLYGLVIFCLIFYSVSIGNCMVGNEAKRFLDDNRLGLYDDDQHNMFSYGPRIDSDETRLLKLRDIVRQAQTDADDALIRVKYLEKEGLIRLNNLSSHVDTLEASISSVNSYRDKLKIQDGKISKLISDASNNVEYAGNSISYATFIVTVIGIVGASVIGVFGYLGRKDKERYLSDFAESLAVDEDLLELLGRHLFSSRYFRDRMMERFATSLNQYVNDTVERKISEHRCSCEASAQPSQDLRNEIARGIGG